jgi:8-oxo-dGTP pyrophosphatase MutT (NUDIX family)
MSDGSDFELTGEEIVWKGRILSVGSEFFRLPDGSEISREKVWHPGAVGIVALDDTSVWLTRQPREVVRERASLEVPAGKLDIPGEAPLAAAKRELVEEIGKTADNWRELFSFFPSPGFINERLTLFLATGLHDVEGGAQPEDDEFIDIVPWPLADLDRAIAECHDAKTLIALLWLAAGNRA